jgi:cysteine synthase A
MDIQPHATIAPPVADDLGAAIGNTPLIKLRRASLATGCTILGKAEFMNPGGSVKDRAGLAIILDAEQRGVLKPGGTVVEGTAGNTGIGLTLVGNARGYKTVIVIPETQSQEKIDFLRMIGADLRLIPAKPYKDQGNYVHVSRRLAEELGGPVPRSPKASVSRGCPPTWRACRSTTRCASRTRRRWSRFSTC